MHTSRKLIGMVIAATFVLVGCGGSDDTGSAEPSATSDPRDEAGESAQTSVTPTTAAPSTSATSPPTTTPTTDPAPTVAPTLVDAGLTEGCIDGDWILSSANTNALITSLLPGVPITVEGSMSLTFVGNTADHYINIVATFTLPNGSLSGPLDQHFAGTYELQDGAILITNDLVEGGWGDITGEINGVPMNVPAPPTGDLPAITGGPATCTADQLTMLYTSGLADSVALFERA